MERKSSVFWSVAILLGLLIVLAAGSSALCAEPKSGEDNPLIVAQGTPSTSALPSEADLDKLKPEVDAAVKNPSNDDPDPGWSAKGHHECHRCRHFCMERFDSHHARERCMYHHCREHCRYN
ncbi:MAG: hypothetical protein HQK55_14455 [Deltaproteobacteria bacterium]|nr:hypothetical protein [Deltaproteobacteria bacterium]